MPRLPETPFISVRSTRDGNAASIIQSIYLDFGSGVLIDGTGIVLQCRGAYFSLDEDHPNRLEGGKRPLHTLMPGMLFQNGALLGPIGAQGGDAQAQVHLQLITNLVDYGMDPQQAIEAPRWVAGDTNRVRLAWRAAFPPRPSRSWPIADTSSRSPTTGISISGMHR